MLFWASSGSSIVSAIVTMLAQLWILWYQYQVVSEENGEIRRAFSVLEFKMDEISTKIEAQKDKLDKVWNQAFEAAQQGRTINRKLESYEQKNNFGKDDKS